MFRSLLCFSIRDILWLTVVVGLAVGWWMDHRKSQSLDRRLKIAEFEAKGLDKAVRRWSQSVEDIVVQLHEHGLMCDFANGKCTVVQIPGATAKAPAMP